MEYFSVEGQQALREKVTVLHCTTEYPAPPRDINLKAMDTMAQAFPCAIGYSDHSEGITCRSPVAAGLVCWKNILRSTEATGPRSFGFIRTGWVKGHVEALYCWTSSGDGIKARALWAEKYRYRRKSLVVAEPIRKGERFSEQNLTVKRPGHGVSPFDYWEFIGSVAEKDYEVDEVVLW